MQGRGPVDQEYALMARGIVLILIHVVAAKVTNHTNKDFEELKTPFFFVATHHFKLTPKSFGGLLDFESYESV